MHHIKLFLVDGAIQYVHHETGDPTNDDPGTHVRGPHGDRVKFKARDDGGFTVVFKTESPFVGGAGFPATNPIVSPDGSIVGPFTLKPITTVTKKFPYTVKLAGVTDDPEIIIDDSGGSGAKKKKKKK